MCELPQCYGMEKRKSRKQHKCYECRGIIEKGEHYNYHHGVWCGQGESYKVCLDCDELRDECDIETDDQEDKTAFGDVSSAASDSKELWEKFKAICSKRKSTIKFKD